MEELSA